MLTQLNALVLAYIHFMNMIGNVTDDQVCFSEIPMLFSKNVTKVENGKVIAIGHEELTKQLANAISQASPWRIEVLDLLEDKDKNIGIVRFTWNSKCIGLHITTAILKFDDDNKITEINEVYNKFAM